MIILEPVQAAVWNCLQNFMYSDAVFLAERLHAELDTEESAHTLAVAYFKNNAHHQAYYVLSQTSLTLPLNKYLFARCCCAINKRQEAEACILGPRSGDLNAREIGNKVFDAVVAEYGDLSCFVFALLGEIFLKTERRSVAILAFRRALALNPFLFTVFQSLCDAGDAPNPKDVFRCETAESVNFPVGTTCWQNFAHTRVTMNQSVSVHPHHQVSHVFPSEHSTPVVPASTPMQDLNKMWLPPAPCKPRVNVGRANSPSVPGNGSGNTRKRQLELMTPSTPLVSALTTRKPAFGALMIEANSSLANSSFLDLTVAAANKTQPAVAPQQPTPPVVQGLQAQQQLSTPASTTTGSINIKDLQPGSNSAAQQQQQHPLRSNPLVVMQTNNFSGDQQHDGVDGGHHGVRAELHPPPLKRSARLQVPTKENKIAASKPGRAITRTTVGTLSSSSGTGAASTAGTKRPRARGSSNALRSRVISVDSENEMKPKATDPGNSDVVITPSSQNPVEAENTKNLEKTAAAMDEDRQADILELASLAQKQSASGLMSLFRELGSAYLNLVKFNCVEALHVINELNERQMKTGWVLCLKARLFFELCMYEDAAKVYEEVRTYEPLRLEGLEYYSSSLWQLQRETDLSALAGSLLEISQHHSVPWVTLANCFSANQEHNSAIKYFQRALQLDHESSYVYTLLAQEYFLVEDIENAQAAFRNALYVNPVDYRAWMGLGMVSFKQEQYKLAKVSYQKALRLNPKSTVVLCHIALCLVKMKEIPEAIEFFKRALDVNPRNPLCKYHLASTYVTTFQYAAAAKLLSELVEETPREAQVFFLLGKIYKKLGEENKSLMYISWAVDLDPKVGKAPWKDRPIGSGSNGNNAENDNASNINNSNTNAVQLAVIAPGPSPADAPAAAGVAMDASDDAESAASDSSSLLMQPSSASVSQANTNATDSSLMQHSGYDDDEDGDDDATGDESADVVLAELEESNVASPQPPSPPV